MARPARIPLFPLDVVLLPTMPLPLHIFEPRYKVMIRRCLDEKLEFGMILAANNAVAAVGCTAEIVHKLRDYPDGRMDILSEGRAVFRLGQLHDEKEYYEGSVEYLDDEPATPESEGSEQLMKAFVQCYELLAGRPWIDPGAPAAGSLAYRLGGQLPMELEKRQELLELRSESERRKALLRWIDIFLPKLAASRRAHERAGGNGHALN